MGEIQGAKGDLGNIHDVLERHYGNYEEALSDVRVQLTGVSVFPEAPLFRTLYFGTAAEADGFGLVRNPVVPELHANALVAGSLFSGFDGEIPTLEVKTRLGLAFGSGYEKRVDAASTDLIERIPVRSGHFNYYGADQEVSRSIALSREDRLHLSLQTHETLFRTSIEPSALDLVEGRDFFAFRWKGRTQADHDFRMPMFDRGRVSLLGIAGPQPLPVEILPRSWDYSHRIESFPELGAMLGAGASWEGLWSQSSSWKTTAGLFGGYWGGETDLKLGSFRVGVGSWGIEASSAYQGLGQRLWIGNLGVGF